MERNKKQYLSLLLLADEQENMEWIEGDEEWGFPGLPAECVPYKNGSLAVQDLINGNIKYVIIDAAPAKCITEALNEMQ